MLIAVIAGFLWWKNNSGPPSNNPQKVDFLIVRGRSAAEIGNSLYQEGLIKSPLAFKIYVQLTDKAGAIQAGEYRLSKNLTVSQIIDQLSKGPLELWVTIPEGLRREEVVERFVSGLAMDNSQADIFRREFEKESEGKEGYLFPDTYLFPKDASAKAVVSVLTLTFDKKLNSEMTGFIEGNDLTLDEIITLASIIERETKTDAERPIVAGILMNRLDMGMALQTDAAVQYAVGSSKCNLGDKECNWWPVLTRDDLEIESPYNTYKYPGLPPAPIANAGLSSIRATIQPVETDYLYYIHDSEGGAHFSTDLKGHNENIRKYLEN